MELAPSTADPEDVYVGPHFGYACISFDLTIPGVVQQEINSRSAGTRPASDRFHIELGYGWQVPVSCVVVLSDHAEADPTYGARAVFFYLKREVARSAEQLVFACIPPIFTHADFFLYPSTTVPSEQAFRRRSHSIPAYHRFEYDYNPEKVVDPAGSFFFEMQSEINLYFRAKDYARSEGDAWFEISVIVDALTASQTPSAAESTRSGQFVEEH